MLLWLVVACIHPPPNDRTPDPCVARRNALQQQITEATAARSCQSDDECIAIAGPGHPDGEYSRVVHVQDRAHFEALIDEQYATCGATYVHPPSPAFRIIEPRCVEDRCIEEVTTFHIEE